MQPTDHMSIDVEYRRDPSKTSGARYHRVTTCPPTMDPNGNGAGPIPVSGTSPWPAGKRARETAWACLVRVAADRDAEGARQTKVGELEVAFL